MLAAGLSKLAGVDASEDDVNTLVASTVPLGKVGAKWDIAIAAVFLCSSAARHLTGALSSAICSLPHMQYHPTHSGADAKQDLAHCSMSPVTIFCLSGSPSARSAPAGA